MFYSYILVGFEMIRELAYHMKVEWKFAEGNAVGRWECIKPAPPFLCLMNGMGLFVKIDR